MDLADEQVNEQVMQGGRLSSDLGDRIRIFGISIAVALFVAAALASTAHAVDEHAFDPVLSLTGDTSVSAQDPVADPGFLHPGRFKDPCGIATDSHGYIYVANAVPNFTQNSPNGHIDIFDPEGNFVTSFKNEHEPCQVAVDSVGNVYVSEISPSSGQVQVYQPDSFPPTESTSYTIGPAPIATPGPFGAGVAVDPLDDHLFVTMISEHVVAEYASAANGSGPIDGSIGDGVLSTIQGVDVCGVTGDIYVVGQTTGDANDTSSRVYIFSGEPGHLLERMVTGSNTPEGGFAFTAGRGSVAVDQSNCDFYVGDIWNAHHVVHQFDEEGNFIGQLEHSFEQAYPFNDLALDSPAPGQTGYDSPNEGYVFVTSANGSSNAHVYAFKPKVGAPPEIAGQEATQTTATEAVLRADLNPGNLPTTYRFEYTSQEAFEAEGYAGATQVPMGGAGPLEGGAFIAVSRPIEGLQPGTAYRFRLVADNEECSSTATAGEGTPCGEGEDATFATYPDQVGLPDARGWELVTPPDTNGRIPTGSPFGTVGAAVPTPLGSPARESVLFAIEGGSLAGLPGSGYLDSYQAHRSGDGQWSTSFAGLTGAEAQESVPLGAAAEHSISFHDVFPEGGSLDLGDPGGAFYLRYRNGAIEPVGIGSLGFDTRAVPKAVDVDGSWLVFATGLGNAAPSIQLEPEAPPTGTGAVYQRTPGGGTHVVSLLPGDVTPKAGERASYVGSSADGSAVAFEIGNTLYLRLDDEETFEVGADVRFAGLSDDGRRLVYLRPNAAEPVLAGTQISQGEIHVFDPEAGGDETIGSGEQAVIVNVSNDGSHNYFASPQKLDGNDGTTGAANLYVWNGFGVSYVASIEEDDLTGDGRAGGLGLWVPLAVSSSPAGTTGGPASDPSRTTPDGSVLVFEASADLAAGYATGGHTEVYRYSEADGDLACVSCTPTGALPASDALLIERPGAESFVTMPPVNAITEIANVTEDGRRVLFQSGERLALTDQDAGVDVYEWRAPGVGNCARPSGCIGLISYGQSRGDEYLYGMSDDGSDVFFWSGDRLLPQDTGGEPSIYDARIGGGAPPLAAPTQPCLGEACQPLLAPPPEPSSSVEGPGNVAGDRRRRCRRGFRAVRRKGHVRCVRRQRRHHHRRGARASSPHSGRGR